MNERSHKRQDDENLTMKERALVALLREMVEKMHRAVPLLQRDQMIRRDLKSYRMRALYIVRVNRKRRIRIPA